VFIYQVNKKIMRKLSGSIEVVYVFSGTSTKNNKPYLQLSNGIEASFVKVSPNIEIGDFSKYKRGDVIDVNIEADGSGITVLGVAE